MAESRRSLTVNMQAGAYFGGLMKPTSTAVLLAFLPFAASGHHSMVEYSGSEPLELNGVVSEVQWANPHIRFKLLVRNDAGNETLWRLEGIPRSELERNGIPSNAIAAGDVVTVAGRVSSRREQTMYVWNALLADRTELLFGSTREPRWPQATRTVGGATDLIDEAKILESEATASGIFRVWRRAIGGNVGRWSGDLPLTDYAVARRSTFDVIRDNPFANCTPSGMPDAIMRNGWPIEFVDGGDEISLRMEAFGRSRTIHLSADNLPEARPATPLGHSIGHWEEGTLVVRTTEIDYPYFETRGGTPQSPSIELTERFSLSDNDTQLHYEITVTDPETFTRPVTGSKTWVWTPGLELAPYECVPDE